ncbi:MAG: hypothetical protein GY730_07285 [bacterium]|nr:hypothetical protein [bacterium]
MINLVDSYKIFTKEILKQYREFLKNNAIPSIQIQKVKFQGVNYFSYQIHTKYLPQPFFQRYWDTKLDSYTEEAFVDNCAQYFWDNNIKPRVLNGNDFSQNKIKMISTILLYPIYRAIDQKSKFNITLSDIMREFKHCLKYWENQVPLKERCAFINHFSLSNGIKTANFENGLSILRIADKSKTDLWNNSANSFPYTSQYDFQKAIYKISSKDTSKDILDVVTAMRLVQAGSVGLSHIFFINRLSYSIARSQTIFDFMVPDSGCKIYKLSSRTDINRIKKYIKMLVDIRDNNNYEEIRLAIRRFNLSYSRHHLEDRLLDLVIALESSVLFGIKQELRYRLALRGAFLLKKKYSKLTSSKLLKKIYDVRSKVVHDGKVLAQCFQDKQLISDKFKSDFSINKHQEFIHLVENVVRDVLIEILTRMHPNTSLANVIDTLESEILKS